MTHPLECKRCGILYPCDCPDQIDDDDLLGQPDDVLEAILKQAMEELLHRNSGIQTRYFDSFINAVLEKIKNPLGPSMER